METAIIIFEFYKKIIRRLKEQDDKYHLEDCKQFSERFLNNPVVALFVTKNGNGKDDEIYIRSTKLSNAGIRLDFDKESNQNNEKNDNKMYICADITVCCQGGSSSKPAESSYQSNDVPSQTTQNDSTDTDKPTMDEDTGKPNSADPAQNETTQE